MAVYFVRLPCVFSSKMTAVKENECHGITRHERTPEMKAIRLLRVVLGRRHPSPTPRSPMGTHGDLPQYIVAEELTAHPVNLYWRK